MFRSIGDLAVSVLQEAGIEQRDGVSGLNTATRQRAGFKEVAGSGETPAYAGMGGGLLRREEQSNPPIAQADERATASNTKTGEGAATEAAASCFGGRRQTAGENAVLRLVVSRELGSVSRRKGRHDPALSNSMLMVVGGRDHAAAAG